MFLPIFCFLGFFCYYGFGGYWLKLYASLRFVRGIADNILLVVVGLMCEQASRCHFAIFLIIMYDKYYKYD